MIHRDGGYNRLFVGELYAFTPLQSGNFFLGEPLNLMEDMGDK